MPEISWPNCVCGASSEWTPFEVGGTYREIFLQTWKCNLCGRPACFIEHDGGNAFVVPRADTEIFPPEVREYLIKVYALFVQNETQIELLRRQYEEHRYLEICVRHNVRPSGALKDCGEQVRLDVLAELGRVVCEDGWEKPRGLTAYPIPPYISSACVHFLAPGTPPYDPWREYWYVTQRKTKN